MDKYIGFDIDSTYACVSPVIAFARKHGDAGNKTVVCFLWKPLCRPAVPHRSNGGTIWQKSFALMLETEAFLA